MEYAPHPVKFGLSNSYAVGIDTIILAPLQFSPLADLPPRTSRRTHGARHQADSPGLGAGARCRPATAGVASTRTKGKYLSQPQANNQNPLAASEPWNLVADGYAETTMLIFERFAEQAISAVGLHSGDTVLDVAGGRIAVTNWAPMDISPAMMTMFGALRAMNPDLPQPQRSVTTLENPEVFQREMEAAGFSNVEIRPLTQGFPVTTVPEFWEFMVKGSAPLVLMKKKLGEELWRAKEKIALSYLEKVLAEKQGELTSDAWLGVGVKSRYEVE